MGDKVVEVLGVVREDGSGDGRAFMRGGDCPGASDERTEVAGDNRAGVTTGVAVSAETAGIVPVVAVASVWEHDSAFSCSRCIPGDPSDCFLAGLLGAGDALSELTTGRSRGRGRCLGPERRTRLSDCVDP